MNLYISDLNRNWYYWIDNLFGRLLRLSGLHKAGREVQCKALDKVLEYHNSDDYKSTMRRASTEPLANAWLVGANQHGWVGTHELAKGSVDVHLMVDS